MSIKISIVIPTYNRANDLKRALESLMSQTYSNFEVIIVDNNSTDNTDEVVNSFNDKRIKLLKVNNGGIISVSRNLGIRTAIGEYVALLDSDDWWTRDKLERSLYELENGADVLYHPLYLVKRSNQKVFIRKTVSRQVKKPVFNDLIKYGNPICNSSVVFRRSLLEKVGFLSEERDLVTIEDFDFLLRISIVTDNFKYLPDVLGFYWFGGGNMTNPSRILSTLEFLHQKYSAYFDKYSTEVHWYYYAKAKAYFTLKEEKKAYECLDKIGTVTKLDMIYFKSFILRMMKVVKK